MRFCFSQSETEARLDRIARSCPYIRQIEAVAQLLSDSLQSALESAGGGNAVGDVPIGDRLRVFRKELSRGILKAMDRLPFEIPLSNPPPHIVLAALAAAGIENVPDFLPSHASLTIAETCQ